MIIKILPNQDELPAEEKVYGFYEKTTMLDPVTGKKFIINNLVSQTSIKQIEEGAATLDTILEQKKNAFTTAETEYNSFLEAHKKAEERDKDLLKLISKYQ